MRLVNKIFYPLTFSLMYVWVKLCNHVMGDMYEHMIFWNIPGIVVIKSHTANPEGSNPDLTHCSIHNYAGKVLGTLYDDGQLFLYTEGHYNPDMPKSSEKSNFQSHNMLNAARFTYLKFQKAR